MAPSLLKMDLIEVVGCFFSQLPHSVSGNKEACFVPEIYLQSCRSDSELQECEPLKYTGSKCCAKTFKHDMIL